MHDSSLRPPTVEFFMHRSSDCRIQSGETRMGAMASAVRIRHDLHSRLINARKRTDDVFRIVREDALYDRPIAERHRIIFYIGHVEAFDWNLLAQRAFGLQSFHPSFDQLFAFGIDPVGGGLPTDKPSDWPSREEVDHYNQQLRSGFCDRHLQRNESRLYGVRAGRRIYRAIIVGQRKLGVEET